MADQAIALTEPRRIGRPRIEYDPDIAFEICEAIATSTKSLRDVLKGIDGAPSDATVRNWLVCNAEFSAAYAQARAQQMHNMADEIIEISDQSNADCYIRFDRAGNPHAEIDGEAIQRSKVRIDTRKFVMSKLAPHTFGDKLDVTSGGEKLNALNSVTIDARVQSLMQIALERRAGAAAGDDPLSLMDD